MRGAEIESGHFLVRVKIRLKIKKNKKTKKSEIKKWDIGQLNKKEIKDSSRTKEQIDKILNYKWKILVKHGRKSKRNI
jgi:hypothetical protein